jgi:hypothetical protein
LVGKNEKIKSNINGVMSIRGSLAVCFDDFKQLSCFNLDSSSLTDTLLFNDYTILVRFGGKDDVNKELWVFLSSHVQEGMDSSDVHVMMRLLCPCHFKLPATCSQVNNLPSFSAE